MLTACVDMALFSSETYVFTVQNFPEGKMHVEVLWRKRNTQWASQVLCTKKLGTATSNSQLLNCGLTLDGEFCASLDVS